MSKKKIIIRLTGRKDNSETIMLGIGKECVPIPAKYIHIRVEYFDNKDKKIKEITEGIFEFTVEVEEDVLNKIHERGHWYLVKCFVCGCRKRD